MTQPQTMTPRTKTVRIKIRIHSGKRLAVKAFPTVHPLLFVTPQRLKKEFSPTGRAQFNEEAWAITHKPSGYCISYAKTVESAKKLAEFLAKSGIPWEKLRSKKQAKPYAWEFAVAKKRFYEFERN